MINDSCKIHSVSIYNLDNTLDKVLHFSKNIFSHTCSGKGYKYLSDSGYILDTSKYHITHNLHSEHTNNGNTHYDAHPSLGGAAPSPCGQCTPNGDCNAACKATGYSKGECAHPMSTDPNYCCKCQDAHPSLGGAAPSPCGQCTPNGDCNAACKAAGYRKGECAYPTSTDGGHCCKCQDPIPCGKCTPNGDCNAACKGAGFGGGVCENPTSTDPNNCCTCKPQPVPTPAPPIPPPPPPPAPSPGYKISCRAKTCTPTQDPAWSSVTLKECQDYINDKTPGGCHVYPEGDDSWFCAGKNQGEFTGNPGGVELCAGRLAEQCNPPGIAQPWLGTIYFTHHFPPEPGLPNGGVEFANCRWGDSPPQCEWNKFCKPP